MSAKKKQRLDSEGGENINPIEAQSQVPTHPDFREWSWDTPTNPKIFFKENGNRVLFNPSFSVGTQAVRGNSVLKPGLHHYYEVLMCSEVYGTDMMIGIGTVNVNLDKYSHTFVSLLGLDAESYGLSYNGSVQHNGEFKSYTQTIKKGDRVGVHVNLWNGSLEFYLNSEPLGIAFSNLNPKESYYPMITSTSARSGMTLTYCRSYSPNLQFNAIAKLRKCPFFSPELLPPGLAQLVKNNFWWLNTPQKESSSTTVIKSKPSSSRTILRRKKLVIPLPLEQDDSSDEEFTENSKELDNAEKLNHSGNSPVPTGSPATKRLRLRSLNGV